MHPQLFSPKPPGTARCAADWRSAAAKMLSSLTASRAGASRVRSRPVKDSPRCTGSRASSPPLMAASRAAALPMQDFPAASVRSAWVRSGMRRTITPAPSLTSLTTSETPRPAIGTATRCHMRSLPAR